MQSKSQILLVLLLLHLYKSFHLHSTICGVTKEKCVCRWFGTITFNIIFATVHRLRYFSSTAFRKPDMSYWSRYVILIQICHIDPDMSYWSRYAILIQICPIDPDMSHWSRYVLLIQICHIDPDMPYWSRYVLLIQICHIDPDTPYWSRYVTLIQICPIDKTNSVQWSKVSTKRGSFKRGNRNASCFWSVTY